MTIEKKPVSKHEANQNPLIDTPATTPHYDRGIAPAETAAREEREGDKFMRTAKDDPQTSDDAIDTTGGYTVDKEGLVDNFAIEPEMYVNEPGDLRKEQEELKAQRAEELSEVRNDDEEGKLTMEADRRGHGPGVI
jgi:hypothetical protein